MTSSGSRLDMKEDFAAVTGAPLSRGGCKKSLPGQGGWHMGVTGYFGADSDLTSRLLYANANVPLNGWADSTQIEAEIAA
jgi:hypothetical protein